MTTPTLCEWLNQYTLGNYELCKEAFFDWFCKNSSLLNKTIRLGKKVKQLANSPKLNQYRMTVLLKNNCPLQGSLYDDIRFVDLANQYVVYTIIPSCGHKKFKGRAEIWGRENEFKEPLYVGNWKGVLKWFEV